MSTNIYLIGCSPANALCYAGAILAERKSSLIPLLSPAKILEKDKANE